jgi:ribosomal protein L13
MTVISVDLAESQLTVKTKRSLIGFSVDAVEEVVFVNYREIKYTGTFEGEDYSEISNDPEKIYKSDFNEWMSSESGQAIKAAIESSLTQTDPNS